MPPCRGGPARQFASEGGIRTSGSPRCFCRPLARDAARRQIPRVATLYVVSTPIGNLEDITHRALRILGEVAEVYAEDTRRTRVLMERYDIGTPLRSLTEYNEADRITEIQARLEAGESVALVSDAGTPLVSDPGTRLVGTLGGLGFHVVPVPGPSAVLTALVGSGLPPVPFTFYGFLDKKGGERSRVLEEVASLAHTAVLFESPNRLDRLLQELGEVCGSNREVAVGRELTKVHEEFFRGTLGEAHVYYQGRPPRGELTVVVAPATPAQTPDSDDPVVAQLVEALLADGSTPKDAVAQVVARFGLPRNTAYALVQTIARGD